MSGRRSVIPLDPSPEGAARLKDALDLPCSVRVHTELGELILEVEAAAAGRLRVDGRRLPSGRRALLGGEQLRHGRRRVLLARPAMAGPPPAGTRTFARAALAASPAATMPHGPSLAVLEGRLAGRRWPLPSGARTIGRSAECDIVLNDVAVSRRHAEIVVTPHQVTIADLGSRHGVRLGRRRARGPRTLREGAEIVLGSTRLRFLGPERHPPRRPEVGGPSPEAAGRSPRPDRWVAAFAFGLLLVGGAVSAMAWLG